MTAVDVAVFTALGWETDAVLSALADVRPVDGARRWRGRLGDGAACLVMQMGIGPQRAAAIVRAAPAAGAFVSAGCAGGLVPWLRTGDLVLATEVVALDAACRPAARTVVAPPPVDVAAEAGAIATAATVLATAVEKTAAAGCGALVVDMESWVVADEAARRGLPFTGIRVVLDTVGDEVPVLWDAIDADSGDVDAWRAARALAARPWLWPAAWRLARLQGEAAARLGEAMGGILRQGARLRASPSAAAP